MSQERKSDRKISWLRSLFKPLPAFITALAVALVGLFGQKIISDSNRQQALLEMINRHQEAEIAFRRDMFSDLFADLLTEMKSVSDTDFGAIESVLYKIELLSTNFSEYLSLGAIFRELDKKITDLRPRDADATRNFSERRAAYKNRLRGIARNSIDLQLALLVPHAETVRIQIPAGYEQANHSGEVEIDFRWPDDYFRDRTDELSEEDMRDLISELSSFQFGDFTYQVNLISSEISIPKQTVKGGLTVATFGKISDQSQRISSAYAEFDLGFYNFPIVDNTVLPNNHRISVMLESIGPEVTEVLVIIYSSKYAYMSENPILNTAIRELIIE